MTKRVMVTEPVHEEALAMLRDAGWQVIGPGATLQPAEALLVRTQQISAAEVAGYRMISKHGVGVDNIALEAAQQAGVAVMNTPGANAAAVAEQALMLMLALVRDLDGQRAAAAQGAPAPRVAGLQGKRLLVVGYGGTGRNLATLGAALGMKVTVHSRTMGHARHAGFDVAPNLGAALARSDIVSLHCPLNDQTRGMIGAEALAQIQKGAFLINCARGGLVDSLALAEALQSGHLGGAGLDVTEPEPLPQDHPLRRAPHLVLTPHAAAMSDGAFRRMGMVAAQNILDHFAGRPKEAHIVVEAG